MFLEILEPGLGSFQVFYIFLFQVALNRV